MLLCNGFGILKQYFLNVPVLNFNVVNIDTHNPDRQKTK